MEFETITRNEGLSIGDVLKATKECQNAKLYNSCFNDKFSFEMSEKEGSLFIEKNFEPIEQFDASLSVLMFDYSFGPVKRILSRADLTVFLAVYPDISMDLKIERDVEDGYIYEAYETLIFNKKYLIFC